MGTVACMDTTQQLQSLLVVFVVAAVTPIIAAALPGPRVPQVVYFIIGGVLIGPHVLGLAKYDDVVLVANIGLGFLFLLAGYELDPQLLGQLPGRLAMGGWAVTVALSVGVTAALSAAGLVRDYIPIAIALTTTALGTLLPILRDNDLLTGDFGRYVLAAGAVGELFPIIAIALFLTQRGEFVAIGSILAVGVLAIALSAVPAIAHNEGLLRILREGQYTTGQTILRWSVVLLFLLLVIASKFGLDAVLGAVLAGIVLRGWTRRIGVDAALLESKFDAVGYGFFIPVFFVASGMNLDIAGIVDNPLRVLLFFLLLLASRGLPCLLIYRKVLPLRQRAEMTFITATAMPLLIALAQIGLQDGRMIPSNAAALVGAGVLSVLVYPAIAVGLSRRDRKPPEESGAPASPDMPGMPEIGLPNSGLSIGKILHPPTGRILPVILPPYQWGACDC
jgi:Kef-type K+ transport system membrane component KefB